jgi:hypothetical protein
MQLRGDCLEPVLPDGATIMLRKSDPASAGDIVCVYFHPRLVKPGDAPAFLKRMVLGLPKGLKLPFVKHPESECTPVLIVEQLNPPITYTIDFADVIAIHKAVAWGPAAKIGTTFSTKDMRPIISGKMRRATKPRRGE